LLFIAVSLHAAQVDAGTSNLPALIRETQKLTNSADDFVLIWWIPHEYWQAALKDNPRITDTQKQDIFKTVEDYTIVGVVDAKKGGLAGFSYTASDVVQKTAKLTAPNGKVFSPLSESDLSNAARNLVSMLKPFFGNLLGQLGQNTIFVVFPAKDEDGKSLIDPLKEGRFVVDENNHEASWQLPLASLLPENICPTCGEHLPGNYKFCPYDGTKLGETADK